jgi:hypothetical protein
MMMAKRLVFLKLVIMHSLRPRRKTYIEQRGRQGGCKKVAVKKARVGPTDTEAGKVAVSEKTIYFWQKHSPNCDFMGLSPYPLLQTYDGWVRRDE